MSRLARTGWFAAALVALVLTGCGGRRATTAATAENPQQAPVVIPASLTSRTALPTAGQDLSGLYEQVNPSVVNIQVTKKQAVPAGAMPGMEGAPDIFQFFGGPGGQMPGRQGRRQQAPQEHYEHGGGSGFVWDDQGHIVTNNHVTEGADKITVTLNDGTTVPAKLVGADKDSDLAVVQVSLPQDRLRPVTVADSTAVKVGQVAVAIGNPFGLEGTMTVGYISALGRLLPVEATTPGASYTIPDVIQTDAPINPGNSGGVLCNVAGEVIGVTSAIISPAGASAGIGFAIPSAIVTKVVPVLLKSGHFAHPWLGLSGTTLGPDTAKAMGLPESQRGALVADVMAGSPAEKAGVRGGNRSLKVEDTQTRVGGDVVVKMGDEDIKRFDDIVTYLARHTEVGQTVPMTVLRDKQAVTLNVKLDARPGSQQQQQALGAPKSKGAWLGLGARDLTPEVAEALRLDRDQAGVLVETVQPGSPADKAGLKGASRQAQVQGESVGVGGDVITSFNGQEVSSMEDLQSALAEASAGDEAQLGVLRGGRSVDVKVTLGAPLR